MPSARPLRATRYPSPSPRSGAPKSSLPGVTPFIASVHDVHGVTPDRCRLVLLEIIDDPLGSVQHAGKLDDIVRGLTEACGQCSDFPAVLVDDDLTAASRIRFAGPITPNGIRMGY